MNSAITLTLVLSRQQLRRMAQRTTEDVPTTADWRDVMKKARIAKKLSQRQLAELVGSTQPNLSDLESGRISRSTLVPAVAAALEIPLPYIAVVDEWDQAWVEAGRLLRAQNKAMFIKYLELFALEAGDGDE